MSSVGGGAIAPAPGKPPVGGPALPDFSKWGEVERKQMTGIRRKTAEHLTQRVDVRFRTSRSSTKRI